MMIASDHEPQTGPSHRLEVRPATRSPLPSAGEIDAQLEWKYALPPFKTLEALREQRA